MHLKLFSAIAFASLLTGSPAQVAVAAPSATAPFHGIASAKHSPIEQVYYYRHRHYRYRYHGMYFHRRYYRHGRWHYY
jgi:hypothetical protein